MLRQVTLLALLSFPHITQSADASCLTRPFEELLTEFQDKMASSSIVSGNPFVEKFMLKRGQNVLGDMSLCQQKEEKGAWDSFGSLMAGSSSISSSIQSNCEKNLGTEQRACDQVIKTMCDFIEGSGKFDIVSLKQIADTGVQTHVAKEGCKEAASVLESSGGGFGDIQNLLMGNIQNVAGNALPSNPGLPNLPSIPGLPGLPF